MNIEQLYKRLIEAGVPEHRFYLHGLFGSTDDIERLALTIYRRSDKTYYEVYFKERGSTSSTLDVFSTESEACNFMFQKLIYERDFFNIRKIEGLNGMTVNERLFASGLVDEFDKAKLHDKRRAREILMLLDVDKASIEKIVS
jgi:hypothetical protein